MHRNKQHQDLNDVAEINRSLGGFSPSELEDWFLSAGLSRIKSFYGVDRYLFQKYTVPNWKMFVLKVFSLQNPFLRSNTMNLTVVGSFAADN